MLCDASLKLLTRGIIIGEPVYTSKQNLLYPLYQNTSYAQIVCQSPWLRLSTPPRYIKRNAHCMYFIAFMLSDKKHSEQKKWIQFISRIQTIFQKWLHKSPQYASYRWVNSLETNQEYTFVNTENKRIPDCEGIVSWKITTVFTSSLKYFDIEQNETPIHNFIETKTPKTVRMMVHFNQIWINTQSQTAGLSVQILQIQDQNIFPLVKCSFQSTSTTQMNTRSIGIQTDTPLLEPTTSSMLTSIQSIVSTQDQHDDKCSHPIYGTFFKMLKKRVPKPAVQHKMRMNGFDPAILDMKSLDALDSSTTHNDAPQQDQLALSLKNDHQLKKTEINTHEKITSNSAGHGFSLQEVVSGLKSLRKTILPTETEIKKKEQMSDQQRTKQISLQSTRKSNSFFRLLGSTFT